ncbi:uncharacterized protein LOC119744555 [Patiria miniata]|uniref:Uncharacterized protein n=1 Tax=Patiria miniata TaxID=46514 RepID=A0A914BJJ6_PATMI|nr:uncharacterized protein LOC119744555 [Patiria miniata]
MRGRELVPCFFAGVLWALLQPGSGYPPVVPNEDGAVGGQFLIKVKAGFDVDAVAEAIENLITPDEDGKVHAEIKYIIKKAVPVIVARLDFSAQDQIQKVPGIEYIEEDGIVKEEDLSTDKDTKTQKDYGLDRINQKDSGLDGNVDIKGKFELLNIHSLMSS